MLELWLLQLSVLSEEAALQMTDIEARRMLGRNWYTVTSQVIEEISQSNILTA